MLKFVDIKNFKSISASTVPLGSFNVLVGPNGSGKSNFIDALSFIADCLEFSVTGAFKKRGGVAAVRRRSRGHPYNLKFRLIIELDADCSADYEFEISARPSQNFYVNHERCRIRGLLAEEPHFEVRKGEFIDQIPGIRPKIMPDRLALQLAAGIEDYRPLFDFLNNMRFYSLVPDKIRELQEPDIGQSLKRDGGNAAAVLHNLRLSDPVTYNRICRLLEKVVPGMKSVHHSSVAQMETIEFKQEVGDLHPWTFPAINMSDGTLRVLGILLAIYQNPRPTVVAIEEPESTIHPAASDILVDILKDGANFSQILITTHSPDILDHKSITEREICAVQSSHGRTTISSIDPGSRNAIRERLYSAGELLRMGELRPDYDIAETVQEKLPLFGRPLEPGQ